MKTIYVVLGVAAVGGAIWYFKNKSMPAIAPAAEVPGGVIPMPDSPATHIIKLPDSLITNTSGNTGIIPPVLAKDPTPIKVGRPLPPPLVKQNLQLQQVISKKILLDKIPMLHGAFILT